MSLSPFLAHILRFETRSGDLYSENRRQCSKSLAQKSLLPKPRTIENESSLSEEKDQQEEADYSFQSAYLLDKGVVPLGDLFNVGTSNVLSGIFLICTRSLARLL